MTRGRLLVHAHFYQPSRVDPFSGLVPADASAAPFRDWNARITAECYRPNAERGTLRHISFDVGPTLTAYLAEAAPDVLASFVAADRATGGRAAVAQAFHHAILPLAAAHDRRTEVRWGLRDFELRFGRPASALWLPETAVDLPTLRELARAGVRATILAPWQAAHPVDTRRPYRVDLGRGAEMRVLFYDAGLSSAVSFDPAATADADRFARDRVAPRLAAPLAGGEPALATVATDGELYGHHQQFRDLFLQRLVAPGPSVPDRGFDVVDLATVLGTAGEPAADVSIQERTSWSCHHGVLRWSAECPDARDGRWKAPLRGALDRLAGGIDAVTAVAARDLPGLEGVWAARDDYADVVVGAVGADAFAAARLAPRATADDRARLVDLLDAQRWRLAMFASDGWYWDDPSRPETRAVLRAAARAVRIIDRLADVRLEWRLVADLALLRSPRLGIDGATIYRQALSEVGQPPPRE